MARKTFFSFHYKRDAWRAGQVRNSGVIKAEDETGFIDKAKWEEVEKEGEAAIRRWILAQLKGTTVTAVLIGAETHKRDWVDYEIRRSWEQGNGIVGVRIHNIKDQHGNTDTKGPNPFDSVLLTNGKALSSIFKTYDWVNDDGRTNLPDWIEKAYDDRKAYTGVTELEEDDDSGTTTKKSVAATVISSPAKPWSFD